MIILHDYDLSANCYAVRLLCSFLNVSLEIRRIDVYPGRENDGELFRQLNPLGTVPLLEADTVLLRDWQAILAHLCESPETPTPWWPEKDARLIEWLGFARLLEHSAGLARLHDGMAYPADISAARQQAHRLLRELERHLWFVEQRGQTWLLLYDKPTAADIAVFVHVILCEEGGIERLDYPAVRRWTDRIRYLDGFVAMSGVFPPLLVAKSSS